MIPAEKIFVISVKLCTFFFVSKQRISILLSFVDLTHQIVKRYKLRKEVGVSAGKTQSQENIAKHS